MSNDDIIASLGDFAAQLVREVSQSLWLAATDAPMVSVKTVRVRFGQPPAEEGTTTNSLLIERYPFLENGWEMEMELDGKVQAQLAGSPLPTAEKEKPLLTLFGPLSLSSLKGINTEWADFFASSGVAGIGDLAGAKQATLNALVQRRRSIKIWEYYGKARLLEMCIPVLPQTALDTWSLYALQRMAPDEILAGLGTRTLSERESDLLMEVLAVLAIAIDSDVLKEITLKTLRQAAA